MRHAGARAALACALGVLQACSSGDAVAPTAPQGPVTSAPSPAPARAARIDRVSPDTLQAGAIVTIEGQDFPAAVSLALGGAVLELRAVSPTRLEAVVPATFPCAAASAQRLRLTTAAGFVERTVALRVATPLRIAPGAPATVLTAAQARCVELPAASGQAEKYVMAIVNTATDPAAVARVSVRGLGVGALANVSSVISNDAAVGAASAPTANVVAARAMTLPAVERSDVAVVERQVDAVAHAGSAITAWSAQRAALREQGRMALRAPVMPGDTVSMTAILNSCAAARPVRARVVYAGARAVVLEDLASPRAGTMDATYRAIGNEFDATVYPLLATQLGDPLALDRTMGGDGRVTMLFTRFVNDSVPGTAGYVSACNFYPKSKFAASNEDEVFYARVPNANEKADDWRRSMRSTVVHEAKHLASFAERIARGHPSEESWLEEATARVAEELYARTFARGGSWKGNNGFAASLECELTMCDDRPLIMWKHFSQLHTYLRGADSLSPLGPRASGDLTWYASGWSLVRWAVDQYAASEPAMLKALVTGGPVTGIAHLAALAGVPVDQVVSGWAASHAVGGTGATWNAADVWSGLSGMFPGVFQAAPLRGRAVTAGAFAVDGVRLPAASATYFHLEAVPLGNQLVSLTADERAGEVRLAVMRR